MSADWTISSMHGLSQIQYSGAISAMIGWKWSPRTLYDAPFSGTIGAWKCAYARTAWSKMPRS